MLAADRSTSKRPDVPPPETSIVPPGREGRGAEPGRVILHDGEELPLERSGDLGERNAGMLIFAVGRERPEYVPWTDIEQIDFDRPTGAIGASR